MEEAADSEVTVKGEVYDLLIMGTQHDQQEEEEGITQEIYVIINHKDIDHTGSILPQVKRVTLQKTFTVSHSL